MKILLLKNCDLGSKDELITVKDGFGQNFIINKGLGILATDKIIQELEIRKKEELKIDEESVALSEDLKIEIEELFVTFSRDFNGTKMFGSIGNKDVSDKLNELGLDVPKKYIKMSKIYTIGTYVVTINCMNGIFAKLNIDVEAN